MDRRIATLGSGSAMWGQAPPGRARPQLRKRGADASDVPRSTLVRMLKMLLRCLLLAVIALLLVEVVVGLLSDTTGGVEKAVVAVIGILLVLSLPRVWRIGGSRPRAARILTGTRFASALGGHIRE